MIDDFQTLQVHHDDDGVAALIGDIELSIPNRNPLEGGVRVRAEIAFDRGPIYIQSLHSPRLAITAQYPPVSFFTNVEPAFLILGDALAIIVANFFRCEWGQL